MILNIRCLLLILFSVASVASADVHLEGTHVNVNNVDEALMSKDFGQRSEAFRLLQQSNKPQFKQVALKMLRDPALLIRLQAVKGLEKFSADANVRKAFWEAFDLGLNSKRGHALVPKVRIFEILAQSPVPAETNRFAHEKNDPRLGIVARNALKKLDDLVASAPSKSLVQ